MSYTRSEILSHRRAWIDFLKLPTTKKHTGKLASCDGESRCCLGHACHVLIPETKTIDKGACIKYDNESSFAPPIVIEKLGLYCRRGGVITLDYAIHMHGRAYASLAELNDGSVATPQEIGEYLETVIEGGVDTPFKPLTSYPE